MKVITKYAEFLTKKPYLSLIIILLIFGIAFVASGNIKTAEMDYSTLLPGDLEVIKANNLLTDSFGGTDQALFVIELDPDYKNEITGVSRADIRDPQVIQYIDLITRAGASVEGVSSSSSASSLFRDMNNGFLPKSSSEILQLFSLNPMVSRYISEDNSMALVKLSVETDADPNEVLHEMRDIIIQTPKPDGVIINIGGQSVADVIVDEQIGPDMGRTSSLSMVGIIIVLFLMFWSVRYALSPMAALGIGIVWAFGYIGLTGMNMNSATSGVISMIMGIGIDFGIQIVTRFRDELEKLGAEKAMIKTLEQVLIPMATTTIAALIGFKAMTMGELTLMADMGTMMSYGITACFFSAITVVPVLLIITSKLKEKKHIFARMIRGNNNDKKRMNQNSKGGNKMNKEKNTKKFSGVSAILIAGIFVLFLLFAIPARAVNDAYIEEKLLNQDPDPAEPGKYLELRWQVLKHGNDDITSVTYELEDVYPFSFDGSDMPVKTIDNWLGVSDQDEEYYILYYKVKVDDKALEGDYKITLKSVIEQNAEKFEKEAEYTVRVGDKTRPELVIGSISTTPKKLVSDTEEGKIEVEIENVGNSDAYNVHVELALPDGFTTTYSHSDSDNIGTILAGQSKTATFYIDVDKAVESGMHLTELSLNFKEDLDETDYYSDSLALNISILSRPVFEIVSVETTPADIKPGNTIEMKIKVQNTGGKDAESVSIKAFKESSQPFNFEEKSDFIGTLNAGETGEAILKFTVDKNAVPKKHMLDLEVRSINEDNVVLDSISLPVEVKADDSSVISNLLSVQNILIVVLLLAVIFMGYRLYNASK